MTTSPPSNIAQQPPRVSSSLQAGTEKILELIAAEREDATRDARAHVANLEYQLRSFKHSADALIAAERAKTHAIHDSLVQNQAILAQYQQYVANNQGAVQQQQRHPVTPRHMQIATAPYADAQSVKSDAYMRRRLEDLQNALQDVGITFCEDNSLRFEAGWASVLAQLEAHDFGVLNAGRLQQVLLQLSEKLRSDRKTILQLEQRVLSSDEEIRQMTEKYEMEIQRLKRELSLVQDDTAPVALSPTTSHVSQTSPELAPVCNVPGKHSNFTME
ncbi:hypothetical protein DXG03_000832 [Asterophora parasitica]|uniref:Uncharacterized protein n=1 Tax=Asterophora parasitica TaxID=117018 RepID=A0A9P7KFX3_9AGAR|nr:hypothetical protein DXG03_000832 [Asterophora parasitica]